MVICGLPLPKLTANVLSHIYQMKGFLLPQFVIIYTNMNQITYKSA